MQVIPGESIPEKIELATGSRIAVVGGGPAGSFFTYFAIDLADRLGLDINIDIYEAKEFNCVGGAGCNRCGGIVSETLVQQLSTEGIVLPSNIVRRGIDAYVMHFDKGSVSIDTPLHEQRIASVYRGSGPHGDIHHEQDSFDGFLLDLCRNKGATVINKRVNAIVKDSDGVIVKTDNSESKKYDLLVGAAGLNPKTLQLFQSVCPGYNPPVSTKTYISEFYLERKTIDESFGHSMHVFLLDLKNITFGALIPKGKYVTLVMLGSDINHETVGNFLNAQEVKQCFPDGLDIQSVTPCKCFPPMNIGAAIKPYSDRIVMIGDSASSKLYKNGIGAAYLTARAAARTVVFDGISEDVFQENYAPACKEIDQDNAYGRFIFKITGIVQKSNILKSGLLQMVLDEQGRKGSLRFLSSVFWDTFTGSASYKSIFFRFSNPVLLITLIWNILTANLNRIKRRRNDRK